MNLRKAVQLVILCAVITLSGILLSGCGEYRDSLERILNEHRIVFGVRPDNLPLSVQTETGAEGLSVDIANEIAARLNAEAEFVFIQPEDVQQALDDGTIDIYVNLPSPGQKETASMLTVDCGMDYRQIMVVASDSDAGRLYDLKDCTICVITGSDAEVSLNEAEIFKGDLSGVVSCLTAEEQFDALNSGKVQAMLIDEPLYRFTVKDTDSSYIVLDEVLSRTRLIIAMRLHDNQLAARIESLFSDINSDGTYRRICSEWLGD